MTLEKLSKRSASIRSISLALGLNYFVLGNIISFAYFFCMPLYFSLVKYFCFSLPSIAPFFSYLYSAIFVSQTYFKVRITRYISSKM